ncbi:MarR family transcriptional regulator [Photobacterium jeanii]|uniref:MarR family transcriptional regulator n=1 Tax=Photobacterium jeanii TaxID=858640 RepID=A0A178K7Q4_9GAMM|nr:MarR family transcriptional regulator [Photobacterium jeanii]OAN13350.1 MarR family transcriptional regulator [Photobacterium jeanii]PST90349.1 MarR family transcriptional regulator [Photobacterium jeanii]
MRNLEKLNQTVTEFYDKMSSWEQSVVKETGYSLAQIHTIEVLGIHGALRMKELAQKLGITTGTLTVQIEKLVKAELIERCPHPTDRRAIVVALTPSGLEIHRHHNQLHLELIKDLTRNIEPEHEAIFLACLEKMNQEF